VGLGRNHFILDSLKNMRWKVQGGIFQDGAKHLGPPGSTSALTPACSKAVAVIRSPIAGPEPQTRIFVPGCLQTLR
jgi:hypothetical protein